VLVNDFKARLSTSYKNQLSKYRSGITGCLPGITKPEYNQEKLYLL